jgi:hypothetical protein
MVAIHRKKVPGSRFKVPGSRFKVPGSKVQGSKVQGSKVPGSEVQSLLAAGEIKSKGSYAQIFGSSEDRKLELTLNYDPEPRNLFGHNLEP